MCEFGYLKVMLFVSMCNYWIQSREMENSSKLDSRYLRTDLVKLMTLVSFSQGAYVNSGF